MVQLRKDGRIVLPDSTPASQNHDDPEVHGGVESQAGCFPSRGSPTLGVQPKLVRVIVAGTRGFNDKQLFHKCLLDYLRRRHLNHLVRFVSGAARSGADRLIIDWCQVYPYRCEEYPADWDTHKRAAGFIRNAEMGRIGDELLAFWDGVSKGTEHMIGVMHTLKKHYEVVHY